MADVRIPLQKMLVIRRLSETPAIALLTKGFAMPQKKDQMVTPVLVY